MKIYAFRLDEKEVNQLKIIAEKEYRSLSQMMRMAIKEFLKKKKK